MLTRNVFAKIIIILFMTLGFFGIGNSYNNVKAESLPKVAMVSLEHSPYVEGDKNSLYLVSGDYDGNIQYQVYYNCEATMGDKWQLVTDDRMVNGWTPSVDAHKYTIVDLTKLYLKPGSYKFSIRVKGYDINGVTWDEYGAYDDVYIFNTEVLSSSDLNLSGQLMMDKNEYKFGDNIKIDGIKSAASNVQYKLHLYNVKTGEWINNLTDYSNNISFNIQNIPEGLYIADIWCKSNNSNNKVDGWKLKPVIIGAKE